MKVRMFLHNTVAARTTETFSVILLNAATTQTVRLSNIRGGQIALTNKKLEIPTLVYCIYDTLGHGQYSDIKKHNWPLDGILILLNSAFESNISITG